MSVCTICLRALNGKGSQHRHCLSELFGSTRLPTLDLTLPNLYAAAAEMAGKMSISGVQEKISLRLNPDRTALEVAERGGRYILKPEPARYASLPQNEHVTMRLAQLAGVEIPPCGLISLKDGSPAYIVKRFDRTGDGKKLAVEDFCQLGEKPLRDKYEGSAELCVRILRKYASEPLVEVAKLFRLFLFGWWVADGDLHLKNLSLLTTIDGVRRLAPAYDLVNTRLLISQDEMALTMGGKHRVARKKRWLDFAEFCRIPPKATLRMIDEQAASLELALETLERSFLPDNAKETYAQNLRDRTAILQAN